MIVSLIAALSDNYVIGKNRGMPWEMPADLAYFFKTTRHHHVIMGRRTYHEFGVSKPLPDRVNIVISRQENLNIEGAHVLHSIEDALAFARAAGETEAFIIGGGNLYSQAISLVDTMYLTFIHTQVPDGDTFFPRFNPEEWQLASEDYHGKDAENEFDYTFRMFVRKK